MLKNKGRMSKWEEEEMKRKGRGGRGGKNRKVESTFCLKVPIFITQPNVPTLIQFHDSNFKSEEVRLTLPPFALCLILDKIVSKPLLPQL